MTAPLRALSVVAPPLAAEIGFRLWSRLGSPVTVHERDRRVHEAAITGDRLAFIDAFTIGSAFVNHDEDGGVLRVGCSILRSLGSKAAMIDRSTT